MESAVNIAKSLLSHQGLAPNKDRCPLVGQKLKVKALMIGSKNMQLTFKKKGKEYCFLSEFGYIKNIHTL